MRNISGRGELSSCARVWGLVVAAGAAAALVGGGAAQARPIVNWVVDANGTWTTAANWSSSPALPGVMDDVVIDRAAGEFEVTLSSGTQTINSLLLNERLRLTAGILDVSTTATINNTVTLAGGTLRNGMWGGTGSIVVAGLSTLSGLTLGAPLAVNNFVDAYVQNGLTLNESLGGMISLESAGNTTNLYLSGTQTIGGTGSIVFNGASSANFVRPLSNGQTATIGPNITIRTGTGGGTLGGNGTVINQGTIRTQTAGQTLTVTGPQFTNQGTLAARAGTISITSTNEDFSMGTMEFLLAGTAQGTDFGVINITGPTILAGELKLSPVEGYEPVWNDRYTIVTGTALTGVFTSFDFPVLSDSAWRWWTEITPTSVMAGVRHFADANRDGAVDFGDIGFVLGSFGLSGPGLFADANENGIVDFGDIGTILVNFGAQAPGLLRNVPAPAGVAVLGIGAVAIHRRGRRGIAVA